MSPFLSHSRVAIALSLLGASQASAVKADRTFVREAFVTPQLTVPNPQLDTTARAAGGPEGALGPMLFPGAVPEPKPQMADGKKLLALMHTTNACKMPLDLKVDGATLQEIAAQIQKLIPAPAPIIEVRGALPVRLSFALKKSTVGEALSTTAMLAGARLWVLSDRLLLAPQTALSDEEQATLKAKRRNAAGGGEQSGGIQWDVNSNNNSMFDLAMAAKARLVFTNLISDELTGGFPTAATANTAPFNGQLSPVAKPTFSSLSPPAKEMMQVLVEDMNAIIASSNARSSSSFTGDSTERPKTSSFQLSPDSIVELNPADPAFNSRALMDWLNISNPTQTVGWNRDGLGLNFSSGETQPSPIKPSLPPVLDPSAGKS